MDLRVSGISLAPDEVEAIAKAVAAILAPRLASSAEDTLFTVKTLAEYLGCGQSWVYERVSRGEIPCTRVRKYLRFQKSAIDRWLATHTLPQRNPISERAPRAVKRSRGT